MADSVTPGILQHADPAAWRSHRFGLSEARWRRLAGKPVWITGAGTGYGSALSVALALAGASVFLTGRRRDKLMETIAHAQALGAQPSTCVALPADITDAAELESVAKHIERRCALLYGVICNAAVPQPPIGKSPLANMSAQRWHDLLETNVTGQWFTARAALPLLQRSAAMRVLFISSEAGWAGTPGYGPYNVSKVAVNGLGMSLAAELGERLPEADVQVNVLVPGEARTEMNQGSSDSPYTLVSMALTLLTHEAGGPNGHFFHRDGRHLAFGYSLPWARSLLSTLPADVRVTNTDSTSPRPKSIWGSLSALATRLGAGHDPR